MGMTDAFMAEFRSLRVSIGLTQEEAANQATALGVPMHQQTIAKLESGKQRLGLNEAATLAEVVGSSLEEMLAVIG